MVLRAIFNTTKNEPKRHVAQLTGERSRS